MRLALIAVGRLKDGPERDLCERYRERALALGRGLGLAGPEIVEIAESRGAFPVADLRHGRRRGGPQKMQAHGELRERERNACGVELRELEEHLRGFLAAQRGL